MPLGLIPWETQSLPIELQKELIRRKTNRSFVYKNTDGWSSTGGDWEKAKGPMTAWVRVCSNGNGLEKDGKYEKPGFIFSTPKNFYQTYGFKTNTKGNMQLLGYTPTGIPHEIENDLNTSTYPIHVSTPEITKVDTIIQKELFRRCTIHWSCYSTKQLEYMTPYFLSPGISVIIEFGWNHFNPNSLIDLSDEKKLYEYYFENPYPLYSKNILDSNGNYDVVYGIVTNYKFSMEGNKINCTTEVTSKDRLYAGISVMINVAGKSSDTTNAVDDTKNSPVVDTYYSSIKKICNENFISSVKTISSLETLGDAPQEMNSLVLYKLICGEAASGSNAGNTAMKPEYWRGVFYGRDRTNLDRLKTIDVGIYDWQANKGDFDYAGSNDKNVWVNMGFIIELLNRSVALTTTTTDPKKRKEFFRVDPESSVIGAHPNLISTDGDILLIPNAIAPKFMYGDAALEIFQKDNEDYQNQYTDDALTYPKVFYSARDKTELGYANFAMMKACRQTYGVYRDNLDDIINVQRYVSYKSANEKTSTTKPASSFSVYYGTRYEEPKNEELRYISNDIYRGKFAFPFIKDQTIQVKNRGQTAIYQKYRYGYFKDLYFNLDRFREIVNRSEVKTYVDVYNTIFEEMNRASGNFWEFALVENDNTSEMVVVDKKMIPSGNNKSTPWYFDYLDTNQLMLGLSFNPQMSEAQAARVVFADANNSNSNLVMKDENDLLDFDATDRILSRKKTSPPPITNTKAAAVELHMQKLKGLQTCGSDPKRTFNFTVKLQDKKYYRKLVLPDSEFLTLLLDDEDTGRNQRYTGIQPITVEVNLQGIGGIRTFMTFLIRNLPNPYNHKNVAYRIVDVSHSIHAGNWITTIKAGIIPLQGYIKEKIGIIE